MLLKALGVHTLAVASVVVSGWCLDWLLRTYVRPVEVSGFTAFWVAVGALAVAAEQSPKVKRLYEQARREK